MSINSKDIPGVIQPESEAADNLAKRGTFNIFGGNDNGPLGAYDKRADGTPVPQVYVNLFQQDHDQQPDQVQLRKILATKP